MRQIEGNEKRHKTLFHIKDSLVNSLIKYKLQNKGLYVM